jgi:hypothetical protein
MPLIEKIVSGVQSGADRAAILVFSLQRLRMCTIAR